MTATELIAELERLIRRYGDQPVSLDVFDDEEAGPWWALVIPTVEHVEYVEASKGVALVRRFVISSD